MKWLFLIILIVLASFGVGLSGGAVIPNTSKRKDPLEINTELVDTDKKISKHKK